MRIHSLLVITAALALSLPLGADHRHGRDCGHSFDSRRGGWLSVQIGTPFGYGIVNRGFDRGFDRDRHYDRYDDRGYYDSRHHKRSKKYFKKLRKQRMRDHRQFRFQRHHVHGPHCWY